MLCLWYMKYTINIKTKNVFRQRLSLVEHKKYHRMKPGKNYPLEKKNSGYVPACIEEHVYVC